MSLPVVAALLILLCFSCPSGAHKRPNVVLVVADDFGYNDVGYHGSEIMTPTLDELAASGVTLENYYVQPICSPTRSQLMSGRYQIHTGLQHDNLRPEAPSGLPLENPTLADKMKEAGYATHMVGKWHLGFFKEEYLPWKRGFDTYFGYLQGAEDHFNHSRAFDDIYYLDLRDQNGPVETENGTYSAHLYTNKTINVINGHDGTKPLFLYLAYQSVHCPLQVPSYYEDKYKDIIKDSDRRTFAGMVSAMDEGIKNVTEALRNKGLWDNTVFIFTTDNGGITSEGGNNYPLRGEKHELWEGGVHGVGFVAGGAVNDSRRGLVNRELIHVSDWFPTVVRLAGGSFNGCQPLDGVDQWAAINAGQTSKRDVILHNIDILYDKSGEPLYPDTWDTSVRAAVRSGRYKLLTGDPGPGNWTRPPAINIESSEDEDDGGQGDTLIFESERSLRSDTKNVWLFDILADPNERNDLSDKMPEVVKDMLLLLTHFNDSAVPPNYPDDNPESNPALHGGVWGPWM